MRIVLVDDTDDARELALFALRGHGATVLGACSARAGFDLLVATSPDLLLSDIGMPEQDGYSLIRRVRALAGPRGLTPAIAITAFAERADRCRALEAGFDAHVSKTMTMDVVIDVIRRVMRGRASGVHPIVAVAVRATLTKT